MCVSETLRIYPPGIRPRLASREAMFDMENTGVCSQKELFRKYEIGKELHKEVFSYIEAQGLDWFSTPSHETDVEVLEELGVKMHKIGSDDATNLPFLRYVARIRKPIFLSTGMCTMSEVREAVDAIVGEGNPDLVLLHAITSYPTHPEDVNLAAMQAMMREFPEISIGYSDHTIGTTACLCAAAMGARVIEKHFTYDKQAEGPDHMLSADPEEMRLLVQSIREFEQMRGTGIKMPAKGERTTRLNNRKSVVLAVDKKAGARLSADDLAVKRPGTGIAPKFIEQLIGRRVVRDLEADTVLRWEDLQ